MKNQPPGRKQSGSFILEALISVILFSIALIALVSLASRSLSQTTQSKARNDASYLASDLIGEMWVSASAPGAFDHSAWDAKVAASLPGGAVDAVTVAGTQVTVTISWSDSKEGAGAVRHHYTTTTQVIKN